MELISLDSSFQPVSQVDNYSSLIWTERYSSNGDFELKSNDVAGMMAALPRGTCVALRESTVPMIVEDYKIDKPFQAAPVITITGRSYETVLERRLSVRSLPATYPEGSKEAWTLSASSSSDAAFQVMRVVLSDPVDRYVGGELVFPAINSPAVSPNDAIPQIQLVPPADLSPFDADPWDGDLVYQQGDEVLYSEVVGEPILYKATKTVDLRPWNFSTFWDFVGDASSATAWSSSVAYGQGDWVTYGSGGVYLAEAPIAAGALPPDQNADWAYLANDSGNNWSPHKDYDPAATYSPSNYYARNPANQYYYRAKQFVPSAIPPNWTAGSAPVVANVSQHFWEKQVYEIKPNYLYNAVVDLLKLNHHGLKAIRPAVGGSKVSIEIYNGADLTNEVMFDASFDQFDEATYLLSERGSTNVAYVLGSTGSGEVLKTTTNPSGLDRRVLLVDAMSDTTIADPDTRRARALIELYKFNATAVFDGRIADQIATGYNTQYHLGDIIKLVGEYGLSVDVRVEEFIRSSDSNGYKAYPAFAALE